MQVFKAVGFLGLLALAPSALGNGPAINCEFDEVSRVYTRTPYGKVFIDVKANGTFYRNIALCDLVTAPSIQCETYHRALMTALISRAPVELNFFTTGITGTDGATVTCNTLAAFTQLISITSGGQTWVPLRWVSVLPPA